MNRLATVKSSHAKWELVFATIALYETRIGGSHERAAVSFFTRSAPIRTF
jgi:hypothetical protein